MNDNNSSNSFYLICSGQIESGEIQGGDNLFIKYHFVSGIDWHFIGGIRDGISQVSKRNGSNFIWNYPLDISFSSTNPYGWPQIVFTLFGIDGVGKRVIRGYGSTHLPISPGTYIKYVPLFTPVSSSLCQRIMSWIFSTPPEYLNPNIISEGRGRYVTRVSSNGCVKVHFHVITKNMQKHGYSVNDIFFSPVETSNNQGPSFSSFTPLNNLTTTNLYSATATNTFDKTSDVTQTLRQRNLNNFTDEKTITS